MDTAMSCHVGCSSEGKLKHGAEHPKMSSKGALANIRPSNCNRVLARRPTNCELLHLSSQV